MSKGTSHKGCRGSGEPQPMIRMDVPLTEEQVAELKQRWYEVMARGRRIGHVILEPPREWVLVKGWHDSGSIDGIYGPYTHEHAEWLLTGMLENSTNNWTLIKLQAAPDPPEPAAADGAAP